jgi:hypothetical protein
VASYETLLIHYAFGEKDMISWPKFVNVVQEFFCNYCTPKKGAGFTFMDLEYIKKKYFGHANVKKNSCGEFFKFLGPFLLSQYVSRDYINLWEDGFLAGFIARESVDLRPYGPGAFLLRYSTGVSGEIVISFVSAKGDSTKHYLVREGDVSPKCRQKLAEFLWKTPNLKFMLKLPQVNNEFSFNSKLIKLPKEDVLREWIPQDQIPNKFVGYVFAK